MQNEVKNESETSIRRVCALAADSSKFHFIRFHLIQYVWPFRFTYIHSEERTVQEAHSFVEYFSCATR